jgi:hypothetical protein
MSVDVRTSTRTAVHHLEVFNFPPSYDMLLGMDLLPQLGIGITGLPTSFADEVRVTTQEFESSPPAVGEQPPSEHDTHRLQELLQPALDRNLATAGEFCTHPDAVLNIDTGDSKPVYVRQYPIPRKRTDAVRQQVTTWKHHGIVVKAPKGCRWNSPLLAVAKKDGKGGMTGTRVCIDPRLINKLINNDGFPIPLSARSWKIGRVRKCSQHWT